MTAKPAVLCIMGPTASGKSQLAFEIARHLPVEILSVDSAQVFRGMDIGTAKPTAAERTAIQHHLVDILDPTEAYSAAHFRTDALRLVDEISARDRVPVLVGGTMLYFKALREGLSELPEADPEVRAAIDAEAAARGWPAMHAELARVDAAAAARLHPTDAQRIQRALEIFRITGSPMSELHAEGKAEKLPFTTIEIALVPEDRSVLHKRIAQRFDAMLAAGLVEELEALRSQYPLTLSMPSMRCVGYRQAWSYLEGEYGRDELRDRGIYATRQLAKRQLTWLRTWTGARVFDALDPHVAAKAIAAIQSELES